MLRKRFVILFVVIFSLGAYADGEYVPGELIVTFRHGAVKVLEEKGGGMKSEKMEASSSIKKLNEKFKLHSFKHLSEKGHRYMKTRRTKKLVEVPDFSNTFLLKIDSSESVTSAVNEYMTDPAVDHATPNYIETIYTVPADPNYLNTFVPGDGNQWGLFKIDLGPLGSGESGWDITTGDATVKVAVIDTGINWNHEDLVGRVNTLEGIDFVNGDLVALDDDGHGTHVSGIIGARSNNTDTDPRGIASVDWTCRLIPIKCFDSNGRGSDFDVIQGLHWAVSQEADVINMSFGETNNNPDVAAAISFASTMETVLVAAAGNLSSSRKAYPAAFPGVIAVAATGPSDRLAGYSNHGDWVDVTAPGGTLAPGDAFYLFEILSTYPFDNLDNPTNESYAWLQGTSMAAPFVSGLASLILAKYPGATPETVTALIRDYSDGIDDYNPGKEGVIGKGRINALASLGGLHCWISDPANGGIEIGKVEVKGNASGEGFHHYTVLTGEGSNPTNWITTEVSLTPLLHSALATFDVTGSDSYFTVILSVNDLPTSESKVTFHAGSLRSPLVIGRVQYGPNPFNPNKGSILLKYDLDKNSDIYIYFFDVTGNLIMRQFYGAGSPGGNQGTNRVYWDGRSATGDVVANGVYLMKLFSEDRTIGSGKIMVLK